MKTLQIVLSILLTVGASLAASAHTYSGGLGSVATATDKWYFICQNPNTASVHFQVRRLGTVTATSPCVRATNTNTVPNKFAQSCDATFRPNPDVVVTTGAGAKFFTVTKIAKAGGTKVGALSYTVSAHCIDSSGVHNPDDQTEPQVYQQNQ